MNNTSSDKFKKLALALGIFIILNVFFNVGIATFYDQPKYDDYCKEDIWSKEFKDRTSCEEVGGQWREDSYQGYCNASYKCQQEWEDVNSVYNRNVFLVLTVAGAVTLIFALYVSLPSAVASGLLYGGVLSMIIGTLRYWSEMDDYLRFIVSGAVLLVLILIGMKKVKD